MALCWRQIQLDKMVFGLHLSSGACYLHFPFDGVLDKEHEGLRTHDLFFDWHRNNLICMDEWTFFYTSNFYAIDERLDLPYFYQGSFM